MTRSRRKRKTKGLQDSGRTWENVEETREEIFGEARQCSSSVVTDYQWEALGSQKRGDADEEGKSGLLW